MILFNVILYTLWGPQNLIEMEETKIEKEDHVKKKNDQMK